MKAGCYIDGHWGIYAYSGIIDIAKDLGYVPSEDYLASNPEAGSIDVIEESETAIDWLNANAAEPGFIWGWHDGEFYYQPVRWWHDEEGDEAG